MDLFIYLLCHYKSIPYYPVFKKKFIIYSFLFLLFTYIVNSMVFSAHCELLIFCETLASMFYIKKFIFIRKNFFDTRKWIVENFENGELSNHEFNYISELIKFKLKLDYSDRTIKGIYNQIAKATKRGLQ